MDRIRHPAVDGTFYPDDPKELREMVTEFVEQATVEAIAPKAVIAPHAGYMYSGSIAGTAYGYLRQRAPELRRVLLLGPSHRLAFEGLALSSATHFMTPLGPVVIDQQTSESLKALQCVQVSDEAHLQEHSLEVQLPFLQCILSNFSVTPVLVGEATPQDVAGAIEHFNLDESSTVIVSSDLSHYLSYQKASETDMITAGLLESLSYDDLSPYQACGAFPLRGLLYYAKEHNLRLVAAHLANSGDTAGDRARVVGYGAFILY